MKKKWANRQVSVSVKSNKDNGNGSSQQDAYTASAQTAEGCPEEPPDVIEAWQSYQLLSSVLYSSYCAFGMITWQARSGETTPKLLSKLCGRLAYPAHPREREQNLMKIARNIAKLTKCMLLKQIHLHIYINWDNKTVHPDLNVASGTAAKNMRK